MQTGKSPSKEKVVWSTFSYVSILQGRSLTSATGPSASGGSPDRTS